MASIHKSTKYGAIIGVFSEWHPVIFRVMRTATPKSLQGLPYIAQFTGQAIADRGRQGDSESQIGDFLSSLYATHKEDPDRFRAQDIHYHTMGNIIAGSDTTAITLSAALYYLCKYPRVLGKLRRELDDKRQSGQISSPVTFGETLECPYLQAVLKETMRVHPGTGLPLGRIVPEEGLTLCGRFFPAGVSIPTSIHEPHKLNTLPQTIIGINSWVAHANREVFGADADTYRPERWLVDTETINKMDQYTFTVSLPFHLFLFHLLLSYLLFLSFRFFTIIAKDILSNALFHQ